YEDSIQKIAKNINAYLLDAPNYFIKGASKSLSGLPSLTYGSMPNDSGNLLFNTEEKDILLSKHPEAKPFIKKFIGAHDFMNGKFRWCLIIPDSSLESAYLIPEIANRLENIKKIRSEST